MANARKRVIYVGKAVSLKKRVASYFRGSRRDARLDDLVREIRDFSFIPTASEAEALILEAHLIKKYDPKYNILLRDDKSFPYIEITKEKFPRVALVRPREKKKGAFYYGPYVNPRLIREALALIRRIFPFCTCRRFPKTPCLDVHLGLCPAPCVGHISEKEYKKNIRHIRQILEGRKDVLYKNLTREMEALARKREYEKAARVRDQIQAVTALYSSTPHVNHFKETEQLQHALGLPKRPARIEAFDISNIMGYQSVGSMVSFLNGRPDKSRYRRFKIKTVAGIDDCRMIAEIIRRRVGRLQREGASFPDLILVDGGKGQLAASVEELKLLEADIPIMALAKREEEVFLPGKRKAVRLPRESLAMRLIQRIRDEAHRFAITYHRKLRMKDVYRKKT